MGDDIYAYANPSPKAPLGAEEGGGGGVYMGKPGSFHVPRNKAANRKQQKEQLYEAYNLLHSLAQVRALLCVGLGSLDGGGLGVVTRGHAY